MKALLLFALVGCGTAPEESHIESWRTAES